MRLRLVFAAVMAGITAAHADAPYFYAERGHWSITAGASACRALNRPPEDFNGSPYNALMLVARPDYTLGVDVFFWPGSILTPSDLVLAFGAGKMVTVSAKPTLGDYVLSSDTDVALWRAFQDAARVDISVKGDPTRSVHFGLEDIGWVLKTLQTCAVLVPKT